MRRKSNNISLMKVDTDFKNRFKAAASTRGLSMLEYSRRVKTKIDTHEKKLDIRF